MSIRETVEEIALLFLQGCFFVAEKERFDVASTFGWPHLA